MGYWEIVIPEQSINEFADPHFFLSDIATGLSPWDLTGDGSGPSVAHDATKQWKGPQCAKLTFGSGGSYIQLEQDLELDTTDYTVSFVVQRSGGGVVSDSQVRAMVDGTAYTADSITALQDGWYRVIYSWTEASGGTIAVGARALESLMILDAMQCEALDHRTTFIAGDQPGCQWLGTAYHSRSVREAGAREGGQVIDLADDYDLPSELSQGAGMPTVQVMSQPLIDQAGSLYLGTQTLERDLLLQVYAEGDTLPGLRALRQDLIAAVRPDSTAQQKPFMLRCTEAGDLRQIGAVYTAGLEGFQIDGFIESIAMRMRALDPMWQSVKDYGASLDVYDPETGNFLARRVQGTGWADLSGLTAGGDMRALAQAIDGRIVVGGNYTNLDGGSYNDYVCLYDPRTDTFSPMERGLNAVCYGACVDAEGDIWVVGNFTAAIDSGGSSVSNTQYIAKFDWSAQAWVSVATGGASSYIRTVKLNPHDGFIYACGNYTTIGGVSANRVAYYDGSWNALGTGTSALCIDITWGLDGTLYAAGSFATAGGVTVDGFGQWDGSAWAACGGGLNDTGTPVGTCLLLMRDGNIMLGGSYDDAGGVSDTECIAIYDVDGDFFLPLGDNDLTGADDVLSLGYGPLGLIWIGGDFTFDPGNGVWSQKGLLRYDGYNMLRPDIRIGYTGGAIPEVWCQLLTTDTLYIGGHFDDNYTHAWAGYTLLTNGGSAQAKPVIYLKRSGGSSNAPLCSVRNDTAKKEVLFDCLILDGETITIDTRLESLAFESDIRGDLWQFIGLGSNLVGFSLLPGANEINAFVDSSSVAGLILWKEVYWSYD